MNTPSILRLATPFILSLFLPLAAHAGLSTNLTTLSLSAGELFSAALRSDGSVWAWGTNKFGELGVPQATLAWSPFPVRVGVLTNASKVAVGSAHGLILLNDGRVFAWGKNLYGQLGNNTYVHSTSPVQVTNLANVVDIAAGSDHSIALLQDGTIRSWGWNGRGELGNNSYSHSPVPVAVVGTDVTNIVSISGGYEHSVVVRSDGRVLAWGTNLFGCLGRATPSGSAVPLFADNITNATAVSAGWSHNLAIAADGKLWVWGYNGSGELGLGNYDNISSPVLNPSVSNVFKVAAGYVGSTVLLTNRSTLAWGHSGATTTNVPVWLDKAPLLKAVTQGDNFGLGITPDGSVFGWGIRNEGQIGDGTWAGSLADYIPVYAFGPFPLGEPYRLSRGYVYKPTYTSFVIPLNQHTGVRLDHTGTNSYKFGQFTPWFHRIQKQTRNHVFDVSAGVATRFPVENPIAAFGSELGGSPLYPNQSYSFGVYAGGLNEALTAATNAFRLLVFDRNQFPAGTNNIVPILTTNIAIPRRSVDTAAWGAFVTNGFSTTIDVYGLKTTIEFEDGPANGKPWGIDWLRDGSSNALTIANFVLAGYKLTHVAGSSATNYHFMVEGLGGVQTAASTVSYFATDSGGAWVPVPLYTLDFQARSPLRSTFVDQPQFEGQPLPPAYAGKTPEELAGLITTITNTIWITNNAAYTNVDNSPELREHPLLNQLVTDLKGDPLRLTSFVINEIELTDPIGDSGPNFQDMQVVSLGGVNRSALGTLLERQGSPLEQCALLVYLLRKAGYPAAYVWPTNNNLQLLDSRLGKLLRMRVKSAPSLTGQDLLPSTLVTVNYPWVVVNLGGSRSVQIFPWLKDTEIVEGLNLYDYLPTNYNNGYKWVKDYLLGKTNILSLDPDNNVPLSLFPKFVNQYLRTNSPGISLGDIGIRAFNRRVNYERWEDLPLPSVLNSQNQVVAFDTLSANQTFLSNVFNTFQVQVYAGTSTNGAPVLDSGALRMADLNNRKFLLYTNTPSTLSLWLAAYRPGITNESQFNDAALTNVERKTYSVGAQTNFTVLFKHLRHRAAQASWVGFLYSAEYLGITNSRPFATTEFASIPINVGRVTPVMLKQHTDVYAGLERQKAVNTNFVPTIEDYKGTVAYVLGMGYYEQEARFSNLNEALNKVRALSRYDVGLAKLIVQPSTHQVRGGLDMPHTYVVLAKNGTVRPDVDENKFTAWDNFRWLLAANSSAQEHDSINVTLAGKYAISTVRLLQLAQARATNGNSGVLELTSKNYTSVGDSTNAGWGTTKLKDQDSDIWNSVINAFSGYDADYSRVFITPGKVTNEVGSYVGMGAMIVQQDYQAGLISHNSVPLNGGEGEPGPDFESPPDDTLSREQNKKVYDLEVGLIGPATERPTYDPRDSNENAASREPVLHPLEVLAFASESGDFLTPGVLEMISQASTLFGEFDAANVTRLSFDAGNTGPSSNTRGFWGAVGDPVNPISGEFYIDAIDLTLPGPFPLEIRRNYLSHNLAYNCFGYNWKPSLMPYLMLTTNNGVVVAYGAEMNGSVIAYKKQTNDVYTVDPTFNPLLSNNSVDGIGSTANLFKSRIERVSTNGNVFYYLTSPNGSVRTYRERSDLSVTSSQGTLYRVRPYLESWRDSRGNMLSFYFGTNSTANDYGQVTRVESSNGNFMVFKYDSEGRIIEMFTGDGRTVNYDYDGLGDLRTVTLPDQSQVAYEYQHLTYTATNNSIVTTNLDSNHLLVRETKPDGRVLVNQYDNQRRVTNQLATVGLDLTPIRNATFSYTNNFAFTNSFTNTITGSTFVVDAFNKTNRFDYSSGRITSITDPLNQAFVQDWYDPSETNKVGYYQRSLEFTINRRGLKTTYQYDSNGNATNVVLSGTDLTGDGVTNAAYSLLYTNNLPSQIIDPKGNALKYAYDPTFAFLPQQIIFCAGTNPITTNFFVYYNVTNVVTNALSTFTNTALGMLQRRIRAYNSTDAATNAWGYDGRGFVIQQTNYTGTTDPNVTMSFLYNSRGELIQTVDAGNRTNRFDYDALGRPKWQETINESGIYLGGSYSYYNENGELVWSDGPRFNPEDYIWRDYDGAGRKTTDIYWRSRPRIDGTGVEAETGDDLYATTFYQYDAQGNLVRITDSRGNYRQMDYDAIGQLLTDRSYDGATGSGMATNMFAYESGGNMSIYTNALGGVTRRYYTTTGRLKQQVNSDGSTNQWTYYPDGRPQREYLPNGNYYETIFDDLNRQVKRTFIGDGGYLETRVFDRRGNLIITTNAAGAVFTKSYDRLDRVKQSVGPAATPSSGQQSLTYTYDNCGKKLTLTDALGSSAVTTFDALGRVVTNAVYDVYSNRVEIAILTYSPDHNSATATIGSASNAIATTAFTDTFGNPVLTQRFPSPGVTTFTLNAFDVLDNLILTRDELGKTNSYAYDALNRLKTQVLPDGATVNFAYNRMGALTNQTMPGGLTWSGTYDTAIRMLSEQLAGGSLTNRQFTYSYYTNGGSVGLLQTVLDKGRSVTNTLAYDGYLRLATNTTSGGPPDQNLALTYQYDRRDRLINFTQAAGKTTVTTTALQRTFDGYGQLTEERVSLNGGVQSDFTQVWDAAGRRYQLTQAGAGNGGSVNYLYQGNGLLAQQWQGGQNYNFKYADNGLPASRSNAWRTLTVNLRDGLGRPLQQTTTAGGGNVLVETPTWRADSALNSYAATRTGTGAWNESRTYQYNSRNQLTSEPVGLNTGTSATYAYGFDANKLGMLTSAVLSGGLTNNWKTTGSNTLAQITQESWNQSALNLRASGSAGSATSVTATLDGGNVGNLVYGSGRWYADLGLSAGNHTLTASATYSIAPGTSATTNTFSVVGNNSVTDSYDGAGNLTNRVFGNGKTQSLTWDGFGRLVGATQRDSSNNGFNWTAIYDGFGRRLRTIHTPVATNVVYSLQTLTLDSFYDPEVEFQEVAVSLNGQRTWKVLGPDLDGFYGSLNGLGGLEATIRESDGLTTPVLNDYFGNVPATISGTTVSWSPVRVGGYGAVLGYQAPVLNASVPLAEAMIWQGRRTDPSGFYCFGARYYDPLAGRFLSPDPFGHSASMDLYSAFGGNPVNYCDPDGRLVKGIWNSFSSGGAGAEAARDGANWLDGFSSRTTSPMLGGIAEFGSQILQTGAAMGSPSTYFNQAAYDYNAQGGGFLGGLAVVNRYNPTKPFYDYFGGIDTIDGHELEQLEQEVALMNMIGTVSSLGAGALRPTVAGVRPPPLPRPVVKAAKTGTYLDKGVGTGLGDTLALQQKHAGLIRVLEQEGQKVMPSGSMSAQLMAELTVATGREVALLRTGGQRVLRLGTETGFYGADASRVIAHTHPSGVLNFSNFGIRNGIPSGDIPSFWLNQPWQRSSVLIGPSGAAVRLPIPDPIGL